jgi:hypothetical protein
MFCINNVVGELLTLLIHNKDCQDLIIWPEFRYPEGCPLWFPADQSNKGKSSCESYELLLPYATNPSLKTIPTFKA